MLECGRRWPLIQEIYFGLTGMQLPEMAPHKERRRLDGILSCGVEPPRVFEVDETQHFNKHRELTLSLYPPDIKIAFDIESVRAKCREKPRAEGGGFGRPCLPLFPGAGGRHRQRAFRDALADILPLEHGFAPTLRVADFEVAGWIASPQALDQMADLLSVRMAR